MALTLYAASLDDTIAAFQFNSRASQRRNHSHIVKFNFVPPPLPEEFSTSPMMTPRVVLLLRNRPMDLTEGRTVMPQKRLTSSWSRKKSQFYVSLKCRLRKNKRADFPIITNLNHLWCPQQCQLLRFLPGTIKPAIQ